MITKTPTNSLTLNPCNQHTCTLNKYFINTKFEAQCAKTKGMMSERFRILRILREYFE